MTPADAPQPGVYAGQEFEGDLEKGHVVHIVRERSQLDARLAGYKQPKYVVVVDELPKNPSGKIVKRQLRESYSDIACR